MFSRQINRRVHDVRSSRCMATLIATEEFASTPAVISNMRPAPLVAESTLASGAKIVSRDTGAPVRQLLNPEELFYSLCCILFKIECRLLFSVIGNSEDFWPRSASFDSNIPQKHFCRATNFHDDIHLATRQLLECILSATLFMNSQLTTFKFAVRGGSRNEAFSEKGKWSLWFSDSVS